MQFWLPWCWAFIIKVSWTPIHFSYSTAQSLDSYSWESANRRQKKAEWILIITKIWREDPLLIHGMKVTGQQHILPRYWVFEKKELKCIKSSAWVLCIRYILLQRINLEESEYKTIDADVALKRKYSIIGYTIFLIIAIK